MSDESSPSATPLPEPTPIEQAALDWFARCNRGLSAEEEEQFEEWLTADQQHAAVFNELVGTWQMLDQLQVPAGASEAKPKPEPDTTRWRQSRWLRWTLPFVAVASLAIGYLSYWRPMHFRGESATEIGALRTMRLPDGSSVRLNTDSEISVQFSPDARRVDLLRGEANFAVEKDPTRPFTVTANRVAVRAVGTAFNVRLAEKSVEVLVLEGKVQVNDSASGASLLARPAERTVATEPPVLASGQRAVVPLPEPVLTRLAPAQAIVTSLREDEMLRRNAWQDRRLEFESAPLAEIVAEFNRFNRSKLVIADRDLGEQRFGGSFRAGDAEGLVRMLRENFGVRAEQVGDVTVLRPAR
jgi:transmembrane sensor